MRELSYLNISIILNGVVAYAKQKVNPIKPVLFWGWKLKACEQNYYLLVWDCLCLFIDDLK